jgi:hypothetical protein
MIKVFDLTLEQPLNKNPEDLCRDMDEDCPKVSCKVSCWLRAPELGICPYINQPKGDKHD